LSKCSIICQISGIASRPHGTLIPLIFYDEDDFFGESSFALFNNIGSSFQETEVCSFQNQLLTAQIPLSGGDKGVGYVYYLL